MITGTTGNVLTLIALGWFFHMSSAFQHANPGIALGLIMAYLLFFEISLGPIFWVMIAEIYPLRSRAKAMAAATMVNWTFNFLISYFFLQMTQDITKAGTFYLLGVWPGFTVALVIAAAFRPAGAARLAARPAEPADPGGVVLAGLAAAVLCWALL
jgi:FtsH-binding integral membrane protein